MSDTAEHLAVARRSLEESPLTRYLTGDQLATVLIAATMTTLADLARVVGMPAPLIMQMVADHAARFAVEQAQANGTPIPDEKPEDWD